MRGVDGDDEATVSSRTVPPAYVPYNGMRTTGVANLLGIPYLEEQYHSPHYWRLCVPANVLLSDQRVMKGRYHLRGGPLLRQTA